MLTVVFSTWNGELRLPVTLEAYCALESPRGGWKLVVVDNGSTPAAAEILRSYTSRLPLTILQEARRGKNIALNSALGNLEGDLAVFSDDDAVPRTDWLRQMRQVADEQPEYSIFGGVTLPRWDVPPPNWVKEWVPLGPAFTLSNPEASEGPSRSDRIFGTNMAVRTAVFWAGHTYNPTIGAQGANYAMGSETELVRRLIAAGYNAWFSTRPIVEHCISREHMALYWILKRAERFGRGQYRMGRIGPIPSEPPPIGMIPYLLKRCVAQWLLAHGNGMRDDRQAEFKALWEYHYCRGELQEAFRMVLGGELAADKPAPASQNAHVHR